MIVLAVRIEVTRIFKDTFKVFFSKPQHEAVAMKQINDVITRLIDPNMYYSRLSFFESGRKAIHIKVEKQRRAHQQNGGYSRFFTRSALVQQLIPHPSEGKVRALFGTGRGTVKTCLPKGRNKTQTLQDPQQESEAMAERAPGKPIHRDFPGVGTQSSDLRQFSLEDGLDNPDLDFLEGPASYPAPTEDRKPSTEPNILQRLRERYAGRALSSGLDKSVGSRVTHHRLKSEVVQSQGLPLKNPHGF